MVSAPRIPEAGPSTPIHQNLGRIIRDKLAGSTDEIDRPILDLTWDYPTKGAHAEPEAEAVLAEINGFDAHGQPLSSYEQLNEDGSTACSCWIYCGVYSDGVNEAARRKPAAEQDWVAKEWGRAWPANRGYRPGRLLGRTCSRSR